MVFDFIFCCVTVKTLYMKCGKYLLRTAFDEKTNYLNKKFYTLLPRAYGYRWSGEQINNLRTGFRELAKFSLGRAGRVESCLVMRECASRAFQLPLTSLAEFFFRYRWEPVRRLTKNVGLLDVVIIHKKSTNVTDDS